jgi:hypothetical protein
MLPSFHGLDRESAYTHLGKFLVVCNTFKNHNISDDGIRLRLFPFSLHDSATRWLNSLPPNSITTWDELVKRFMTKYYPVSLTNSMRKSIQEFKQKPTEQFPETWDRFQDLLLRCPHHGIDKSQLVQYFYNGLTSTSRTLVQSMHKGKFMALTPTEAYKFLMELGEDMQTWDSGLDTTDQVANRGGMYEIKPDPELKSILQSLTKTVEGLVCSIKESKSNSASVSEVQSEQYVDPCQLCQMVDHIAPQCPYQASLATQDEQACAFSTN